MNEVTLCITSHNPNENLLTKLLQSAEPFDKVLLHINHGNYDKKLPSNVQKVEYPISLGVAPALNMLIEQADTEWISVIGDDDFFLIDELKKLIQYIKNEKIEAEIIHFPVLVGNEKFENWKIWGNKQITFDQLQEHNGIPCASFFRKTLWKKINGYEEVIFNDWHFWLKAYKVGAKVYFWPLPVYKFRQAMEEKLSDKEYKTNNFNVIRENLLKRLSNVKNQI